MSAGNQGNPGSKPRFPQLQLQDLDESQRAVADEVLKTSKVGLIGFYNILLRSPELGACFMPLSNYIRFELGFSRKLVELAILIHARMSNSQFEWWAHAPLAAREGLSIKTIESIRQGHRPETMSEEEDLVYRFCVELCQGGVSEETFEKMRTVFSDRHSVDLSALLGFYSMVSTMLSLDANALPAGEKPPLEKLAAALPLK